MAHDPVNGFEATLRACEKLGLDLTGVSRATLQIFYNSGQSFCESPGAMTSAQRQLWRDSVIWPKERDSVKRGPGRPRKNPLII